MGLVIHDFLNLLFLEYVDCLFYFQYYYFIIDIIFII